MKNSYCWDVAQDEMNEIKILLEEQKEYVTNYGFVTKKIVYDFMLQSEYWLYPCTFEETFCITALEAQMAGCICISNDLAALPNINKGIIMEGDVTTLEWQDSIIDIIMNKNVMNEMNSREFASQFDWAVLAQKMVSTIGYPKKNVLDDLVFSNMYNWTSDVPKGSKEIFLDVLDHFVSNACKILEIGTYAGTSIINMLHYLPDATATVIDLWEDYEESSLSQGMNHIKNVFENNIIIGGVSDRIAVIVGDSKDVLIDLLKKGVQYDFIYVDGSHHCLDCYSDIILGWNLLSIGGIMGIDDYLWQPQIPNTMLDYPYYGVAFFMKRYSRNIKVINVGYRVFLKKIE
jgi:predicted O-methyltransferase YrrM